MVSANSSDAPGPGAAVVSIDPAVAGRVVVVTGAGGGIGGEAARLLTTLGARVVATDSASVELERNAAGLPGGTPVVVADLASERGARQVVETAVEAFGRIDGLVSAAGIYRMAPAELQDLGEARQVIEVNVLGAINIGVLAMRHMPPGSSIVNFTSGAQWGMRQMAPYAASKGAIASLTYAWALDLAHLGIRVNAISPTAATGMTSVLFDALELDADARAEQRASMADPGEIAPLIAYLVSSRSGTVNGQTIRLDRGRLSVVSRPAIVEPVLARQRWTLGALEAAFDHAFNLQPHDVGAIPERPFEDDAHAAG